MKAMQCDYEKQISLRDQELFSLNEQLSQLSTAIRTEEEHKYDQRLALIKKIHEEQLAEARRQVTQREIDLEEQVMLFNKEREAVFARAKEEAMGEERLRTKRYMVKLERIKDQELALAKRELQRSQLAPSTVKTEVARVIPPSFRQEE
jgi:hypothetical protein